MRKKQKPLLNLDALYVIPTKEENVYASLPDPEAVDKLEKYMKKVHNYENCECEYNDECPEPHCRYCRINLENNKAVYFTCGHRRDKLSITPLKCPHCKTPMNLICGNSGFSYWSCGICNKEFEFHIQTEQFTDEINK